MATVTYAVAGMTCGACARHVEQALSGVPGARCRKLDCRVQRILVVDDDPSITSVLKRGLAYEGFAVDTAASGAEGLALARERPPDLVILDVMMPGLDGFATLREIRRGFNVPVIMLTARGEEDQKVRGLALGADDYVTKPFSQKELLARVQAVLRRAEQPALLPKTRIDVDDELSLDFDRAEALVRGRPVHLTATEYRLLYHLASNPGRLMPTAELLAKVWGYEYQDEDHYVRLYISYLRQKLEPDPAHPKYILTVPGLGYKFVDYRPRPPVEATASAPHHAG
jgi:two-component system KDP operon response regulator KdpE